MINAKEDGCKIIIQVDGNAKVGKDIIRKDPNTISNNGKILLALVDRQGLVIGNASSKCTGTITRKREILVENKKVVEKSVIDYLILCDFMYDYLDDLTIDEERNYVLRHVSKRKKSNYICSDHNMLIGKYNLPFRKFRGKERYEFFNFKNEEARIKFLHETNLPNKFSSHFHRGHNFLAACNCFFKQLNSTFHKCFKKIRIRNEVQNKSGTKGIQLLLEKQTLLKDLFLKCKCEICKRLVMTKLLKLIH